ncbi:MAG: signal recognition particle-docking protein FtsY [Nanoarchaeota archaeon]
MFKLLKDKLKSFFGKSNESKESKKETKKTKVKAKKETKPIKIKEKKQIGKKKLNPKNQNIKSLETEKADAEVGEQQVEAEIKEEKKGFFSSIVSKFTTAKITKEQVEEIFQELEIILLENNVALEVVDKIKENLIKDLEGQESKAKEIKEKVINSIKKAIEDILIDSPDLIKEINEKKGVYTILFFGINGTGKTTSIAKIANLLKDNKISVVLAAADTFRAAAIEQLEIHANNLKIPIIKSQYSADPTSVAFEAKSYAENNKIKCVLIDTAGRMYTKENLIKQMEKLIRVINPDKKIFVGESTAGNDLLEQIKTFNDALKIDGIILSKADIDEKGGATLSASYLTGKPIYFIGTGQSYGDIKQFRKKEILESLGLD